MRLAFDDFEIDTDSGQLFCADKQVPLERRACELLCYLVRHPGRVVTKDELLSEVWCAQALSDNALSNAAAKLRKALGQAAGSRQPLETVRGRGYRWHAAQAQSHHCVDAPNAQAALRHDDPYVGRIGVTQLLDRAIEQAALGSGQLVLIAGDAGIGKTRTLDELTRSARARGFSVWEGAAHDGGAPPYWPWVEILRCAHADLSRAVFRRHLASDSWAMSLLVPELAARAAPAPSADAQATRFRLNDEVARFVASASTEAPRLITVDDVHWADDATIELLAYAARVLKKRPVMLAVTLREHDGALEDARGAALARLGRQATRLTLSGLSIREVGELVVALAPDAVVDPELLDALQKRTQGNPFFVRQSLELLAQRGLPLQGASLQRLGLPVAVRDLLRQRTDALPDPTRRVLRMAASVGHDFDAGLVAQALELATADVLAALEPALRAGVICSDTTPNYRFSFGHALLRSTIYDALELVERGTLHARIVQVLAKHPSGDEPRVLGEIAHHALLAVPCQLDACVQQCCAAAAAARTALGFGTAANLLARVCDKLASEGGDERVRCQLLLALGIDRFCAGDIREAWRALRQGAAIAEQIGSTDLLARFACVLAGWLELGGGDEDEIRELVDRALSTIGDRDDDLRANLLARRAQTHFELPAHERYALLDQAEALASHRNAPSTLLEIALCRVNLPDPARLDDTRRAIARYRALDREHRHVLAVHERLLRDFAVGLAEYLCALTGCDLTGADGALERCRRIAEQSQLAVVGLSVELMRAGRAFGEGRLDDTAAIVQRMSDSAPVPGGFGLVWTSYAVRLMETRGEREALAAIDVQPPMGFEELRPTQRMNGTLWLARLSAKLGAHDKARRLLATIAPEQVARMPVRYGDLGMLCFLAETHALLGDRVAAAARYAQLAPYAALNAVGPTFEYTGAVAHYLGMLADLLGRRADAVGHFEHAERINCALRMPIQLAWTRSLRASRPWTT